MKVLLFGATGMFRQDFEVSIERLATRPHDAQQARECTAIRYLAELGRTISGEPK